jgi:hypothetical protein
MHAFLYERVINTIFSKRIIKNNLFIGYLRNTVYTYTPKRKSQETRKLQQSHIDTSSSLTVSAQAEGIESLPVLSVRTADSVVGTVTFHSQTTMFATS